MRRRLLYSIVIARLLRDTIGIDYKNVEKYEVRTVHCLCRGNVIEMYSLLEATRFLVWCIPMNAKSKP